MSEFYGLAETDIIERMESGDTISSIAKECGKNRSTLCRWLNADPQRSARAQLARISAAAAWDEKAEDRIELAEDAFELSRAKELAHHYRWRASKIAPKEYGDKVEHEHKGRIAIAREMSDDELASIAAAGSE